MDEKAWDEKLLKDPHAVADKRRRVQRMFAAIAPSYDLNNRLHSFWQDQRWRRKAVKLTQLGPADIVVDVACGTGDLAIAFATALHGLRGCHVRTSESKSHTWHPGQAWPTDHDGNPILRRRVIGIDFTHAMLAIARTKSP